MRNESGAIKWACEIYNVLHIVVTFAIVHVSFPHPPKVTIMYTRTHTSKEQSSAYVGHVRYILLACCRTFSMVSFPPKKSPF